MGQAVWEHLDKPMLPAVMARPLVTGHRPGGWLIGNRQYLTPAVTARGSRRNVPLSGGAAAEVPTERARRALSNSGPLAGMRGGPLRNTYEALRAQTTSRPAAPSPVRGFVDVACGFSRLAPTLADPLRIVRLDRRAECAGHGGRGG